MADTTPRAALPYLVQSQAQKEVTHNEALNILDAMVQTAVEAVTATPPTGVEGKLYVVGTGPTGAWSGKANYLTQYINRTWVFYSPFEGMRVWDKATAQGMVYKSGWVNELSAYGKVGFYGATAVTKPTVTGSRGGNAALASLLTQLATLGLITDSTTA